MAGWGEDNEAILLRLRHWVWTGTASQLPSKLILDLLKITQLVYNYQKDKDWIKIDVKWLQIFLYKSFS